LLVVPPLRFLIEKSSTVAVIRQTMMKSLIRQIKLISAFDAAVGDFSARVVH
jgi:hypothetical protein